VGEHGVAKTALKPKGTVLVHGELWNAEADAAIEAGEAVVVSAIDGLKIRVTREGRPAA